MQVWAEHNYYTRLLHRDITFPLLKKLTEGGDPLARKVFKEEIAKCRGVQFQVEDFQEFLKTLKSIALTR